MITVRIMRWSGNVARVVAIRQAYEATFRKSEGKRLRGRLIGRWDDNIKTELTEIYYEVTYWIHWAQNMNQWRTIVDTVMNLRFAKEQSDL